MKKKRKTKQAIKDLHLDKPTSHGGWPDGHPGSYTDPNKPVHKQIADYLNDMGLVDDSNPRARLSEDKIRSLVREALEDKGLDAPDIPGFEHRIQPDASFGEEYRSIDTTTFKEPRHWLAKILKVHYPLDGGVFYDYVITNHPKGTPLYYDKVPKKKFHKNWKPANVPSLPSQSAHTRPTFS